MAFPEKSLDKTGVARLWYHIISRLSEKVDVVEGKGLSTNDYTDEEKSKLSGIEKGANKTIVDSSLSDTSTNPVQNKVIKSYIDYTQIDDGSID